MPTLKQIRTDIREQVSGYVTTDDNRLRDRFLDEMIRTVRAVLIKDEASRGLGIDPGWTSCVDCLSIQCGSVTCGSSTLRLNTSYSTIDPIIDNPLYVGSVDGLVPFSLTSLNAIMFFSGGSFNKPYPAYAVDTDKLILKGHPSRMRNLRMCAALEDPTHGQCGISAADAIYPVPADRVYKLELLVIKQLLSTLNIQPDLQNNARDDQQSQRPVDPRLIRNIAQQ